MSYVQERELMKNLSSWNEEKLSGKRVKKEGRRLVKGVNRKIRTKRKSKQKSYNSSKLDDYLICKGLYKGAELQHLLLITFY